MAASHLLNSNYVELISLASVLLGSALAYLALPSFRYESIVNSTAKNALTRLEALRPQTDECTDYYCLLVKFAGKLASKIEIERHDKNGQHIPESEPKYFWEFLFTPFALRISLDVFLCLIMSVISLGIITYAVAERIEIFRFITLDLLAANDYVRFWFWVVFCALPIPLVLITAGRSWISWAKAKIEYWENNCLKNIKAKNITESIPSALPIQSSAEIDNSELAELIKKILPMVMEELGQTGKKLPLKRPIKSQPVQPR